MTPPVYVAFTTSKHWLSYVIKLFTGGSASHVELVFYSADLGGWVVLGSQTGGFILTPFEYRDEEYVTVFKLPPYNLWSGIRKNRVWLGAKYDIGALLGMAWVSVVWLLAKRWVRNPLNNRRAWFCSEVIRQVLADSNVPMTLDMYQASTTPEALRQALLKVPGIVMWERPDRGTIYEDAKMPMP